MIFGIKELGIKGLLLRPLPISFIQFLHLKNGKNMELIA